MEGREILQSYDFCRPLSLGPASGTMATVGALEERQISDCNFSAPSPPRSGKGSPAPGKIWMLEVAGRIKTQRETHSRWYSPAGTVVTGWDSTREVGEPGETWRQEKSWAERL